MRILFIHEVNYRNKVIFEMHEFPELLALRGHDVTFFHFPETPDAPKTSLRTRRERISGRAYPDAELELVTPPTFGGGRLERYLAPILDLPALRAEIGRGGYDVILLYAVPTTGWQTIAVAKRSGVPVVFRALDVSHKIRSHVLAPLVRIAERYIYRNAILLSANNPAMAEYCIAESGRTLPTVVNLPPVDLAHFEAEIDDDRRAELGLTDRNKILLYMGTFFRFSGLDIVMRQLVPQFAANPDLRLVLVGGGEMDRSLRELAAELDIEDRVVFTGVVPYASLPGYLKIADVAINPFYPELLTHVALPHKVLQYMASGVPAVSTKLDGLHGVLGSASGVTWVHGPQEVASAAVELLHRGETTLRAIAKTQKTALAEKFSRAGAVESLEATLLSAVSR